MFPNRFWKLVRELLVAFFWKYLFSSIAGTFALTLSTKVILQGQI